MGGPNKLLEHVDDVPMVETVVRAALASSADEVVVVTGDVPMGATRDEATGKVTSGTLRTAAKRLDAVAEMGFDVLVVDRNVMRTDELPGVDAGAAP